MFFLLSQSGIELSSRLIDLNLENGASRDFLLKFLLILLAGFGLNFLVGLGKTELSRKEIEALAEVLRDSVIETQRHLTKGR